MIENESAQVELVSRFERENPDFSWLPESTKTMIAESIVSNVKAGIPLEQSLDIASEVAREAFHIPRPASAEQFQLDLHLGMLDQDRKRRGMQ
jgi:hypothetical protein